MEPSKYLVIISNYQQYCLLVKISSLLGNELFYIVKDESRHGYFGGVLKDVEVRSISLNNHYFRLLSEKKEWKYALNKVKGFRCVITFTEGGVLEWIYLSAANACGVPSICVQWSMTSPLEFYERELGVLAKLKKRLIYAIRYSLRAILGIKGGSMYYLGGGQAKTLFTIGDYWTNMFLAYYPKLEDKFLTLGIPLNEHRSVLETDVLIVFGGTAGLYSTTREMHINESVDIITRVVSRVSSHFIVRVRFHPRENNYCRSEIINTISDLGVVIDDESKPLNLIGVKAVILKRSTTGLDVVFNRIPLFCYGDQNERGFDFVQEGLADEVEALLNTDKNLDVLLESVPTNKRYEKLRYYVNYDPDIALFSRNLK